MILFAVHDFHWLTLPIEQLPEYREGEPMAVTFKIRHTPEFLCGTLLRTAEGQFAVQSATPIHGVAPGQFCVVYDANHHRCYGSGEITVNL